MFAADPVHPDIEDVLDRPVEKEPTPEVDKLIKEGLVKPRSIPTWVWLLGGGALAYFLFFRKK